MTRELLEADHTFWSSWFLSRLMYHTIPCLLNHPLLLTLQIHGKHNVTEAFLHQAAFSITNHVSWFMHFLQIMRSRDFVSNDLVMVYCTTVIATIELQRSLSREVGKESHAKKSQENFDECLKFITNMEARWALRFCSACLRKCLLGFVRITLRRRKPSGSTLQGY
ncbi:conserved hypothetical protein [Verticillium alfalfae VaMs.102]|uniref:C6 transcription factor n=1 Tax=Verticillium alfalfae (strain VaMs.102 / ATCC MYA-4576 / FGSC 10136) TaxID=526221 RepID=C9SQU0_VERA1|nr:conserved hypothetical protein [Verticillium alfalfae VaMs.102]EEY21215.1 conserved hypothetical protein [Verticillium alfalfae VaMs.102]